jgi:hypothetical protein
LVFQSGTPWRPSARPSARAARNRLARRQRRRVLPVGPGAGSVSQPPVEAGHVLRARLGHAGLGAETIAEQRPGGTDRIAHVVAVQHRDDLHCFLVRQQHARPWAWPRRRPIGYLLSLPASERPSMTAKKIGRPWPLEPVLRSSDLLSFLEHQFEHGERRVGPQCSFCGTFTGPFSQIEGLFTVLICIPCLEIRLAQPDTLLGLHDPGPALGEVGLSGRRLRPVVSGPLVSGGAYPGRASGLDGHPRTVAAVSEPASAGHLPPQDAAGALTLPVGRWGPARLARPAGRRPGPGGHSGR